MVVASDGPTGLTLRSFRLKNFKAVRDSGEVRFTPITVFIGQNGSGKSSLIEGLLTYQSFLLSNLDQAMQIWKGYEYIHNPPIVIRNGIERIIAPEPMEFTLKLRAEEGGTAFVQVRLDASSNLDNVFIVEEKVNIRSNRLIHRHKEGRVQLVKEEINIDLLSDISVLSPYVVGGLYSLFPGDPTPLDLLELQSLSGHIADWQFIALNPSAMMQPRPRVRSGNRIRLNSDGSNIAEYLLDIRQRSPEAFDGIIETMQYVLPYAKDIEPALTAELERTVYLQMAEENFKIPAWLMSTGTLRVLAILALLRDPDPPPLIAIEEIENGLDPRTIHLIVEELRAATENDLTQVIITTHSPYLLDLMALSQVVVVERKNGETSFSRPADQHSLDKWAEEFSPGQLYTMSRLNSRSSA